jgi:hypothetical protein
MSRLAALTAHQQPRAGGGGSLSTTTIDDGVLAAEGLLEAIRARDGVVEKRYNYAKTNAEGARRLQARVLARKLDRSRYNQLAEQADKFGVRSKRRGNLGEKYFYYIKFG